jgi:hypothetical protein
VLEETLASLSKRGAITRLLTTKISKTSVSNELLGKLEIEFAKDPQQAPSHDLIRMDKLVTELQKKAKKKTLLLMVDEIQHLATSDAFLPLTYALRTVLGKSKRIREKSEKKCPEKSCQITEVSPDKVDKLLMTLGQSLKKLCPTYQDFSNICDLQ